MINIFDSHSHYNDEAFDIDRNALLRSLPGKGVCGVVECGCDLNSSLKAIEIAHEFSFVYAAVGVHGQEAATVGENELDEIEKLYCDSRVVAVGEIGLDYYYNGDTRSLQLETLEKQLITANRLGLPVIIHDREAHADTLDLLTRYRPKGVVHCFSGSAEMAKEVVKLGMYVGIGGAATFKNARKPLEVASAVPQDRLLIETDCPYMTPVPFRGKRNDSSLIPYSALAIAAARGTDAQSVLDRTAENARRLFGV